MADNKNELKVVKTEDGSFTVYNALLDETYHSSHGALQESMHVFIKNGFDRVVKSSISILEIGLGTGLNASLTAIASLNKNVKTNYIALEPFPLSPLIMEEVSKGFDKETGDLMKKITQTLEETPILLNQNFSFTWYLSEIQTFITELNFDLIYYDAFAPDKQPDMWTYEIFDNLYRMLKPGGLLTTYCAKGSVKRMMKAAGFDVKNCEGPPGKREMTLAYRL